MKYFLTFIFLLSLNICVGHDIKMAIFEIFESEKEIKLRISIDKDDFLKTVAIGENLISQDQATFMVLACGYFDANLAISMDGQCTSFSIDAIEHTDQTITFEGALNFGISLVKEVRIENTCMIDQIENHDNIIKVKLNNKDRSFRLNVDRTSTTVPYNY